MAINKQYTFQFPEKRLKSECGDEINYLKIFDQVKRKQERTIVEPRDTDTKKMNDWVIDLLITLSIITLKTNKLNSFKKQ